MSESANQTALSDGIPRPGRRFDAWLSREVLGYNVVQQKSGAWHEGTPAGVRPLKQYTNDIAAAWELVERLNITMIPVEDGQWFALAGNVERWKSPAEFLQVVSQGRFKEMGAAVGTDVAFTICMAAYYAVESRKAIAAASSGHGLQEVPPLQ